MSQQAHLRRPYAYAWYCLPCLSKNRHFEVGEAFLCGHLSVTSLLLCIGVTFVLLRCSLIIVLWCGVCCRMSSSAYARCIRWSGFALIRLSCCCVIDVMLMHCVCCTRLIRTRIIVCSVSFHLLLSEFDMNELRLQLIH